MGLGVWGWFFIFGFGVVVMGVGVWRLGFGVQGSGFRVEGMGVRGVRRKSDTPLHLQHRTPGQGLITFQEVREWSLRAGRSTCPLSRLEVNAEEEEYG